VLVAVSGAASSFASTRLAARQYIIVSRLHEDYCSKSFGSRQYSFLSGEIHEKFIWLFGFAVAPGLPGLFRQR
jgi:hypothetical protein